MTNDLRTTRRTVLKTVGASLSAIGAVGTAAADEHDEPTVVETGDVRAEAGGGCTRAETSSLEMSVGDCDDPEQKDKTRGKKRDDRHRKKRDGRHKRKRNDRRKKKRDDKKKRSDKKKRNDRRKKKRDDKKRRDGWHKKKKQQDDEDARRHRWWWWR